MTEWVNNWPKYKAERDRMRETRDCTVISFCEVWGAPYNHAHEHLKRQFGRPTRRGPAWAMVELAVEKCPKTRMEKLWGGKDKEKHMTLGQFCKAHPEGRHWVFVRGHALAVIDGVIHDHSHKPKRRVKLAFRVYV